MMHTNKLMRTILSLIMVLSLLVGCSLMFVGCAKTESSNEDPAEKPSAPVEDVVDKKNDPKEYVGLEKAPLLRKLASNHLRHYMDSIAAAPVQPAAGGKVDMTLTVGDTILDLLEEGMGEGADLSFLEKISLTVDTGMSGEATKIAMGIGLNSQTIVTVNMLMNMAENVMYMGIPELNETWIEFDLSQMMDPSSASMQEATAMIEQLMAVLPDGETIMNLLSRYVDIALAELTNVEQSTETLTVGGITQDCTALTLKIYETDAINMIKAVLTEAKDDSELKGILEDLAEVSGKLSGQEVDGEQFYGQFQEGIEGLLQQMDEELANAESTDYLQLVTYVDSKYNIAGIDFFALNGNNTLSCYNLIEGDKFAFEASFPDPFFGADESKIVGSGKVSNGKTTGTYTWMLEEYEFLVIEVKDLDEESGTVTLRPTEDMMDELGIALPFVELGLQIKLSQEKLELNILSASTLLLGISVRVSESDGPSFGTPADTVDAMDSTQMQQWAENLDLDKLLDKLEAAGIPGELIDAISNSMNAEPEYSEPEYDWYY